MKLSKHAFQIRIQLNHTEPSVWRVISISEALTLEHLHEAIQVLFGWKDFQYHHFVNLKTNQRYEPDVSMNASKDQQCVLDTKLYPLKDVLHVGESWLYYYDDGEEWVHTITIEDRYSQEGTDYRTHLLDWEEDNITEEAGSIQAYYERRKILFEHDHPDHADMIQWFRLIHLAFDEDEVESQLSSIVIKDMYDTYEDNYEQIGSYLEQFFQYIDTETVIDLKCDAGSCFVQFLQIEGLKSVHFFQTEEAYVHTYFERSEDYQIHPLYQNGAEVVYSTPKLREELELMIDFPMDVMVFYHESLGNNLIDEGNEWNNLLGLCEALDIARTMMIREWKQLPEMKNKEIVSVQVKKREVQFEIKPYEPVLKRLHIPYIFETMKELKEVRHTDERLMMELLPIPAIYGEERKYQFYFAAMGEKTSMLHRLQEIEYPSVLEECIRYMVDDMKMYGAPKEITLSDYHFYWHFHEQLEAYGIKLCFQRELEYDFNDMYADAFMESNPLTNDKKRRMMMLLDMSDQEVSDYMDKLSDEETQDLLKDMALFHFIK